ncbi:MAG: hypothetical protein J5I98_36275 [Phaeodactylibacter sp.]|nr:hypothetical protein [Phaeodactylibacter sp.]
MRYHILCVICLAALKLLPAQRPRIVVQSGHSDPINSMVFTYDEQYLLSGGNDNSIIQWEVSSGLEVRKFWGHEDDIMALASHPSKGEFASLSRDAKLNIWNLGTGEVIKQMKMPFGGGTSMTYDAEGNQLFIGGGRGKIQVWDCKKQKFKDTISAHKHNLSTLLWYSAKKELITVGDEKVIKFWNMEDKEPSDSIVAGEKILSVAISQENNLLAISRADSITEIWSLTHWSKEKEIPQAVAAQLVFADYGSLLLGARSDSLLIIWEVGQGFKEKRLKSTLSALCVGKKRGLIAGIYNRQNILLLNIANQQFLNSLVSRSSRIHSLKVSADSSFLISGGQDNRVRAWNLSSGLLDHQISCPSNINDIAFDAKSNQISGGYGNGKLSIMNLKESKQLPITYSVHERPIASIDLDPSGEYIATGAWDMTVKVVRIKDGQEVFSTKPGMLVQSVEFSPDGQSLLIATGGYLLQWHNLLSIWDWKNNLEQVRFPKASMGIYAATFSPDGQYVVASEGLINQIGQKDLKVYDAQTGDLLQVLTGHDHLVHSLAFSPDGKYLASGGGDVLGGRGELNIWETSSWEMQDQLVGHENLIRTVEYTPDGTFLISSGHDAQIIFWNLKTKRQLHLLSIPFSKEYIYYLPDDYYYWSSKYGHKALAIAYGGKMYSFEQFDLRLNRPDLILQNLPFFDTSRVEAYRRAYHKRLEKYGFTEEMFSDDFHLPSCQILNRQDIPVSTHNPTISLQIHALDSLTYLDRLNVYVNDVPIYGVDGISLRSQNTQEYASTLHIPLSRGENKIQVSALNQGGAESLKDNAYITCNASERQPNLHLIALGTSNYNNSAMNLQYVDNDVEGIINFFSQKASSYKSVHAYTLLA